VIDNEEVAVYGVVTTDYEDVPKIIEAVPWTVGTCDVVGGSGAVTEGVVALEGMACNCLKGGTLEVA
jgi:hypothetical protein